MNMKHRRNWHVHIIRVQSALLRVVGQRNSQPKSMQHQLPLAEVNPFGAPSCASGVKGCCPDVLVKVTHAVLWRCRLQKRLIFSGKVNIGFSLYCWRGFITKPNPVLDRGRLPSKSCRQFQKIVVHHQHGIGSMLNRIQNLLWRKTNIDRVQHRANHWHREKALKVAVSIPIHHRNGVTWLNAKIYQSIGQAFYPLMKFKITDPPLTGVYNLLVRMTHFQSGKQMANQ